MEIEWNVNDLFYHFIEKKMGEEWKKDQEKIVKNIRKKVNFDFFK